MESCPAALHKQVYSKWQRQAGSRPFGPYKLTSAGQRDVGRPHFRTAKTDICADRIVYLKKFEFVTGWSKRAYSACLDRCDADVAFCVHRQGIK